MSALILVVDDNPANLKLACDLLACEGYDVLRADAAESALQILERAKPDLILMDISMPGMDGLTLTRKLKADARTRDIVVVALTASAMSGDEDRVMAAGCDGYISKPIDTRAFPGQVARYCRAPERTRQVLVVDDNATNRKLLRAILEADGLAVVEAVDGVDALEVLHRQRIDAVVSDILMPRMDGYRLCYEVRSSERLRRLPFIIYTSTYTSPGDEKLAHDMGADRYLTKPAPASAILDALRMATRRAASAPPSTRQPELVLMKEYSQQLVTKLEERNSELAHLTSDLELANGKLRHLLAHSPAVIYGLKLENGAIVPQVVSDNIIALLGFAPDEALCHEWWLGQLHPDDRQGAIDDLAESLTQTRSRAEYRLRCKDGTYRWVDDNRCLVRDAAGVAQEIIGVWTDITERRQAEQALRESETRFRELARHIPEVFWMTTPDMSSILYVSPAYETVWGRPVDRLYAHPHDWIDAIVPEDCARVGTTFAGLATAAEVSVEYRIRRPDGTIRWLLDRGFSIRDADGKIYRTAGIATDITERKQLDDALRQAQKLEAIGQLAGGIAHEINTPMQYIGNNVRFASQAIGQLLESAKGMSGQSNAPADLAYLTEEIPRALRQSLEGVERVTRIVASMRSLARRNDGTKEPANVNSLIESAATIAASEWKHVAKVALDLDPDLPMLRCLSDDVSQVFLNLIVNAAHAIADSPRAGAAGVIAITSRLDGNRVEVRVADNGTGIAAGIRHKVFDPFFTTKEVGRGTGQGLSLAHAMVVQRHGGSIRFETEEGAGTTFIVTLPLEPDHEAAPTGATT